MLGQRCGRLIQDENAGVLCQRLHNLNQLLLTNTQVTDAGGGSRSTLNLANNARALRYTLGQSTSTPNRRGSRPKKIFSATVISSTNASS